MGRKPKAPPAPPAEPPPKQDELDGLKGKGVEPIKIPELDKIIAKYQRVKTKRCEISPAELSAKRELYDVLRANQEGLSVDDDGNRFYRKDGRDYALTGKLKITAVDDGSDGDGDE